jgi:hypothetical protein
VVHGSTQERFQSWLQTSIEFSKQTLPADRRLVLVNAWNEWAEGAHLEPDTRYGYAYLNSVGRALSAIPYEDQSDDDAPVRPGTRVHFSFPAHLRRALELDKLLARKFFHTLARSSVLRACDVTVSDSVDQRHLPSTRIGEAAAADFILEFRRIAFFSPTAVEGMLRSAQRHGESVIVGNTYDANRPLVDATANGSVHAHQAHDSALVLYPRTMPAGGFKNYRMRADAHCFVAYPGTNAQASLPIVTTIIRFHKSGDLALLRDALCSLAAMRDCNVKPLIAAQDLSDTQAHALSELLQEFLWPRGSEPEVHHYRSAGGSGDLRSKMLNESLRRCGPAMQPSWTTMTS